MVHFRNFESGLFPTTLRKRFKLFSPKSSRIFGAAGEFCCHSLHRSQISKDLRAMQANLFFHETNIVTPVVTLGPDSPGTGFGRRWQNYAYGHSPPTITSKFFTIRKRRIANLAQPIPPEKSRKTRRSRLNLKSPQSLKKSKKKVANENSTSPTHQPGSFCALPWNSGVWFRCGRLGF